MSLVMFLCLCVCTLSVILLCAALPLCALRAIMMPDRVCWRKCILTDVLVSFCVSMDVLDFFLPPSISGASLLCFALQNGQPLRVHQQVVRRPITHHLHFGAG